MGIDLLFEVAERQATASFRTLDGYSLQDRAALSFQLWVLLGCQTLVDEAAYTFVQPTFKTHGRQHKHESAFLEHG